MDTRTSTLEMALMGLLLQSPQSGYDLRKTFASSAWRHYSDSPGSIYPALKRLQARAWIAAPSSDETDARSRTEFRPTRSGKAAFVKWLAEPLTAETVRFRQQEIMLRFAFMDDHVPRTVAISFLEQLAHELTSYIADLRDQHALLRQKTAQGGKVSVHTGLLAFEAGLAGIEAQLAWARKSRSRLIYAERK